jgi:hypothetical protein
VVGIGIPDASSVDDSEPNISIRDAGLWYPAEPSLHLDLNDRFFTGEHPVHAGFQPMMWTHFGGPRGKNLRHLTRVSCQGLENIQFEYDDETANSMATPFGYREQNRYYLPDIFEIDGPGGEIIADIDVFTDRRFHSERFPFLAHCLVVSVKVRRISCSFRR